jgi:sterol desaturase/sphingolipid hydroxylase (fatty acid hydroxylase superfamily)
METELTISQASSGQTVLVFTLVAFTLAMLLESMAPRRTLAASLVWRWFNNFSLAAVSWWLTAVATTLLVFTLGRWTELQNFGLLQQFDAPLWLSLVTIVVVSQGLSYGLHIVFHKVAWLWPLHAIHHLDTDLDVSTSFRHHPLETVVTLPLLAPAILLLGVPAEAALANQLFSIGMNVFSHSNVYLPERLDRVLRLFIVTPDFHRLHHCAEQRYTDSNYGNAVPWFDYLFGTASARPFKEQTSMSIGLEYLREPGDSRVDRLLLLPFTWRSKRRQPLPETPLVEETGA